jgi:hypothetical protein
MKLIRKSEILEKYNLTAGELNERLENSGLRVYEDSDNEPCFVRDYVEDVLLHVKLDNIQAANEASRVDQAKIMEELKDLKDAFKELITSISVPGYCAEKPAAPVSSEKKEGKKEKAPPKAKTPVKKRGAPGGPKARKVFEASEHWIVYFDEGTKTPRYLSSAQVPLKQFVKEGMRELGVLDRKSCYIFSVAMEHVEGTLQNAKAEFAKVESTQELKLDPDLLRTDTRKISDLVPAGAFRSLLTNNKIWNVSLLWDCLGAENRHFKKLDPMKALHIGIFAKGLALRKKPEAAQTELLRMLKDSKLAVAHYPFPNCIKEDYEWVSDISIITGTEEEEDFTMTLMLGLAYNLSEK